MKLKLAAVVGTVAVLAVAAFFVWPGIGERIGEFARDPQALQSQIAALGIWGPITIVLLRAAACLAAAVPSSPVALVAGAVYGNAWGSGLVLLGGECGAIAAFLIARWLGRDTFERRGWIAAVQRARFGAWLLDPHGSQNRLMAAVFCCRSLPLLNLDAVSYVAGITPLRLWRFALATFGGLLPYTVLLVSFGNGLMSGTWAQLAVPATLLAALLILLVALKLWRR